MLHQRPATRVTVFLTEDDRIGRRPAVEVLLERARLDGVAGATVWRGAEGFGRGGRLRSVRFVDAGQGAPLAVELIDTAERMEGFAGTLGRLAPWSLVTREQVWASTRQAGPGPQPEPVERPTSSVSCAGGAAHRRSRGRWPNRRGRPSPR